MDYEITSTPLIVPDSIYSWLCEQDIYKEAMLTDRIIGNRYIMSQSECVEYGRWVMQTASDYAQEYLKSSKQTLFKGD